MKPQDTTVAFIAFEKDEKSVQNPSKLKLKLVKNFVLQ